MLILGCPYLEKYRTWFVKNNLTFPILQYHVLILRIKYILVFDYHYEIMFRHASYFMENWADLWQHITFFTKIKDCRFNFQIYNFISRKFAKCSILSLVSRKQPGWHSFISKLNNLLNNLLLPGLCSHICTISLF